MLEERLGKDDARAGFVLDGYPRNLAQARALEQLLARLQQPVDIAVQLDVDTALLVERIAGRAAQEGRADDTPESVRNRLNVYTEQTAPVVEFYRNAGKLACVHGVGSMDEVFTRIVEAINPTSDVG
jgi:adenylate kinase